MKITWKKVIHPGWREMEDVFKTHPELRATMRGSNVLGKWHYKGYVDGEAKYSILAPALGTFHSWEAYMGDSTPRFKTLKEAQKYCEDNDNF